MVITAPQVDGDPVIERQATGEKSPAGAISHRTQDTPIDEQGRESGEHRYAQDARQDARLAERSKVFRRVDSQEVRTVDRRRPPEIAGLPQPARDQGIVNATVLEAIEWVEAFQTQGCDIVLRVIDDRDHY